MSKSRTISFMERLGLRAPALSEADVTRQVIDGLLALSPELREAYSRSDLELAMDDRGWINSSMQGAGIEFDIWKRRGLVIESRLYWHRDPLAKQAVRLWTDYTLANGVSYTAEDPAIQAKLDAFWKLRANRRVFSVEAQRSNSGNDDGPANASG